MRSSSIRLLSWSSLAGAALLVLVGVAWVFTQESLKASAFVSHTHAVISAIGEAQSQVFRAEASQRSYLSSLDPRLAQQREEAVIALDRVVGEIGRLTVDNPAQQRRVVALQALLDQRVAEFRRVQQGLETGRRMTAEQRLDDGATFRDQSHRLFASMQDEERALLAQRQLIDAERARTVELTFVVLLAVLIVLLPWAVWRLRTDAAARREAEESAALERRDNALHARALTLYNAESDLQATLDGTLALLAEGGLFPVSALYLHDEFSGTLRLTAARGAPTDVKPIVRLGEGPAGEAARLRQSTYVDGLDEKVGWTIETGLGRLKPVGLLACPVTHQGKLLGVLVLAALSPLNGRERDFVERLVAQLGVALHNLGQLAGLSSLATALRERSADVERKNEELQRATRMKTEFLANMSHELRTPLNAVIGFSEILRDGMVGALTPEQTEFVGHVHTSGKHLLSLINDILDLSKVEAGQMSVQLEAQAPSDLAAGGLLVVRQRAAERGLHLVEQCDVGLGPVLLDGRKVKQILGNLLSNAVKFTPQGGTVTLRMRRVSAAAVAAAALPTSAGSRAFAPPPAEAVDWLEIEVADTGIGIAPDGLRKLFEPFVQIDSSMTREYEGTGLGLTMVQRLAELQGGGMRVHSVLGEGSTFTVWLPWRPVLQDVAVNEAPSQPVVAAIQSPALPVEAPTHEPAFDAAAGPPLVLIIDDDATSADLLRAQLQSDGYRVAVALSPTQGLAMADQLQPQAVVLDVLMPEMDGWEMLTRLKEHASTRHIPVVIVSITDDPLRGFALGAAQVLLKPVSKDDLLAALEASRLTPSPAGTRVLVVDDDPSAVMLVCKQIESAGYEPVRAYGGQEALDHVARQPPSLIVLDLMMPNVSGFDVVESLGSHAATAHIPIIVLTAKLVTARDRELLRGRVQRLMEKSAFDTAVLLAEVKRALSRPRLSGS